MAETWVHSLLGESGKGSLRACSGLLIFALSLQMLSVWNLELSAPDSARVAGIAREMAVTSTYLIPRLNGQNFLEYPPLGYWPIACALLISERPPDFLAFLPIVFLGTGTVLITFLMGNTLAGEGIGLVAGFILTTTSGFLSIHRHCRVDPTLLFFITLSLYGFAAGYRTSGRRFLFFAIFYLAMAGAFLSKGMIGVAVPMTTSLVFLIARKDFKAIREFLLSPSILLFLLPVLLWGGAVAWIEGPRILREVIRQSLYRFLSPSADHAKPLYYYFIPAFLYLMPWTLLPLFLLRNRWTPNHSREVPAHSFLLRFALFWSVIVFIGLSLASAKRNLYLGPILPPFSLLAALGWDRIREKFPKVKRAEIFGLIVIYLVYVGSYFLFIIPSERKESLWPIFKAVSSQRAYGPVYLVNPSEAFRGAAFFYLGKRIPILNAQDLLLERVEDQPGTTYVMDSYWANDQLHSSLTSRGYRLVFHQNDGFCVYSKG